MANYIAYLRKSSRKKSEEISIEQQERACKFTAEKQRLTIVDWYSEVQSAYKGDRKAFSQLLARLKKDNDIEGVIIAYESRASRNRKNSYELMQIADEYNKIIVTPDYDTSTVGGRTRFSHALVEAQSDSEKKSKDGPIYMHQTYCRALLPKRLPLGYSKKTIGHGKSRHTVIDIDETAGILIQQLFKVYAKGKNSMASLAEKFEPQLLRYYNKSYLPKAIEKILHNCFYYGHVMTTYRNVRQETLEGMGDRDNAKITMRQIKKGHRSDVIVDYTDIFRAAGAFKPLISQELFAACATVLKGNCNGPIKKSANTFAYKQGMKCSCGRSITAQYAKGKKYIYYHCTKTNAGKFNGIPCSEPNVEIATLEKEIQKKIFSQLYFSDSDKKDLEKLLIKSIKELNGECDIAEKKIQESIKVLGDQLSHALEAHRKKAIDDIEFVIERNRIRTDRERLTRALANTRPVAEGEAQRRTEVVRHILNFLDHWKVLDPEEQEIIYSDLVSNCVLTNKTIVNIVFSPFGAYLAQQRRILGSARGNRTPVTGMRILCPNR